MPITSQYSTMTTYFCHQVPCTYYAPPMFVPMPPIHFPPPPLLPPAAEPHRLMAPTLDGGNGSRPPVEYEVVNGQHYYMYNVYPPNGRFPPGLVPSPVPLLTTPFGMRPGLRNPGCSSTDSKETRRASDPDRAGPSRDSKTTSP